MAAVAFGWVGANFCRFDNFLMNQSNRAREQIGLPPIRRTSFWEAEEVEDKK